MKYFLLILLSLPLFTACTVIEENYGPYEPPPRAEVYRYDQPVYGHSYHRGSPNRGYPMTQGQARPVQRYSKGENAVIVKPRNQTGPVPANIHGNGQALAPQNTHGHGPVVVSQNTQDHGQAAIPQNTHAQASIVPVKKQAPESKELIAVNTTPTNK